MSSRWRPRAIPPLTEADIERFWAKVDRETPHPLGCWLWTAATIDTAPNDRRGQFRIGRSRYLAPRVAYFIAFGAFDWVQFVLHSCDNPLCCNPQHLFLGTAKDNAQDMLKKGRAHLPREPTSVETVRLVRQRLADGESGRKIAAAMGLTLNTVRKIRSGKRRVNVV